MAKTRQRLGAGTVLVAAMIIACGQANGGGSAEQSGGNGGHAASVSSGGSAAGSLNSGGAASTPSGGSTTTTGGAVTAAGGASGGHIQTSGGRSPTGGEGGNTAGAVASGGKPAGGASSAGSGGEEVAGAGGIGGTGGASECALIKCTATCKENWVGLDGCPTCACAPPAATLSVGNTSCPSASITLTSASSYYIGGVNSWLIDFDWACSDQSLLGEPSRGHLQVGIHQPLDSPISGENRTFFFPRAEAAPLDYFANTATIWLRGSGVPEIERSLQVSSSFLSVRLENGVLVGGIEYKGSDSTGAVVATMAGPFSVAVPTPN